MLFRSKKLNDVLQRVRQSDVVKQSLANFQVARNQGQWARAGTTGEALLPKFLELGPAFALEGGVDVLAAMYNAGQYEKGFNAAKAILAKHPNASGVLYYLSLHANQLVAVAAHPREAVEHPMRQFADFADGLVGGLGQVNKPGLRNRFAHIHIAADKGAVKIGRAHV